MSEAFDPDRAVARAIVVLGCAVRMEGHRLASGALARRIDAAARAYAQRADVAALVVASGGRRWGETVEADAMARELALRGVPGQAVVRERCSLTTADNARFSAALLGRRGVRRAVVVTCAWHMPRAIALFARAGVDAEALPVFDEGATVWRRRAWRSLREGFLSWVEGT